jgi:hypothetical protein
MSTTVRRWRCSGRDRLYVSDADGTYLGWHDLVTGRTHYAVEAARGRLDHAVNAWSAQLGDQIPHPRRPGDAAEPA